MKVIVPLLGLFGLSACVSVEAPPLIDTHTVMESEAAGEWPELETRFLKREIKAGPVLFPKEGESARKKRVFNHIKRGPLLRE